MEFLTQEEAATLKVGELLDVQWFSPRKRKDVPTLVTREFGGRTEYLDSVDTVVVNGEPYLTASDGYLIPVRKVNPDMGYCPVLANHCVRYKPNV